MADNGVDELIKSVSSHPGVKGFIIVNHEGLPIRHSFDETQNDKTGSNDRLLVIQYAHSMQFLAKKAKDAIKQHDSGNDLVFLRLRSHKHEILVAPERDYILIVIQEPVTTAM
jgi:dynein light chain roadblock-type